jgi:hypothetical protein
MTVMVEIPMALPSVANGNKGGHWAVRARRTKAQRNAVLLAMKTAGGGINPLAVEQTHGARLAVTLTRVGPRALDDDNLAYAFKACRDSVAAYFGIDDADPRIEWVYGQQKGPACVRIDFEVTT